MKYLHGLFVAASAAFFIASTALAQNAGTITNHAFAVGKGAGTTGYSSLLCGSAQLAVGQAAADPICQTITGDVTISAGGVTTISASAVTYAKMQNVTASRLLGNATGSPAVPSEISLDPTLGFSAGTLKCTTFGSSQAGCVPGSGGGTTNFLRADGTWAAAAGNVNGQAITPSKVNSICYIDGTTYATLAAALTACSSNATIIVPSNQTISANITISGANVRIRCENGATLTYSANVTVTVTGSGNTWDSCKFVGPGIGTNTTPPVNVSAANNFTFLNNSVSGFGYTAQSGILTILNSSHDIIRGNIFSGNADFDIDWQNTVASSTQTDLTIDNNTVGVLFLYTNSTTTHNANITISNNRMSGGTNASTDMNCLNILGTTTAFTFNNVTIANNSCKLINALNTAGSAPYSVGGIYDLTFTGNMLDNNGFAINGYGLEFAPVQSATITGNTVNVLNGSAGTTALVCNYCMQTTIGSNVITGFGTGASSYGIQLLNQVASAAVTDVTISNNTVHLPSGGAGAAIEVGVNATSASIQNFEINGNVIVSDRTAGSRGIDIAVAVGTMAFFTIGPNNIRGPVTGTKISAGASNWCYVTGFNDGTTALSNSGGAPACN